MSSVTGGERRGLLLALSIVAFIILCGLGAWQLQRLAWKQDLVATVESRIDLPPVAAIGPSQWPTLDYDEVDYLPVTVTGTFDHDLEIHTYVVLEDPNGPEGGQGYFVMTPLTTEDGWVVIINRGFVPDARKEADSRLAGQIEGGVEVTGLLRQPQGRNAFTPPDDIAGNIWFTRDPAAIATELGFQAELVAPYYVDIIYDAGAVDGSPQGGETTVTFSNNHLQYVVTWFGLAAALAVIVFFRLRARAPEDTEGTTAK